LRTLPRGCASIVACLSGCASSACSASIYLIHLEALGLACPGNVNI
jgi:hypothetical protein